MFGYIIHTAGMKCTSHLYVSELSGTANAATPGLTLRGQFYVVDKTLNPELADHAFPLQGAITFGMLLKLSRACTVHRLAKYFAICCAFSSIRNSPSCLPKRKKPRLMVKCITNDVQINTLPPCVKYLRRFRS